MTAVAYSRPALRLLVLLEDTLPYEGQARPPLLPERLLAKLWMARAGRRMRTTDGRRLRVVYPGRPAPGHGPDFRDAVIELDGERLHGPVELHRRPADWAAHGHSTDPAYDNVVLHVVGDAAGTAGAPDVPTVAMGPDAVLAGDASSRGMPLARLVSLDEPSLRAALRRAGMARFAERVADAAEAIERHGVEQALYVRIMDALGYAENRDPFVELARRLPVHTLRAAALAFPTERRVALLGDLLTSASGLGPPTEAWLQLAGAPPMRRDAWRLAGVRPSNHPLRRMAAVTPLLVWALPAGLAPSLAAVCSRGPTAVVEALRRPGDAGGEAVLGEQRAREVAVNAVLPVLAAWARAKRDRGLARASASAYAAFPSLGENTVTREARRLLGDAHARLRLDACEHQGLMRLYRLAVRR